MATVERAAVLQNSNRLTVHLQPCEVIARVALRSARAGAELEVAVARRLADALAAPAYIEDLSPLAVVLTAAESR